MERRYHPHDAGREQMWYDVSVHICAMPLREDTCVNYWNCAFRLLLIWGLLLAFATISASEVSINLPLDDPAYPLLEKIVSSNLTFINALTLKPITRLYAARLVAEAIAQRRHELETNQREDPFIDQILEYLTGRFKSELQKIGFLTHLGRQKPVVLAPFNEQQLRAIFANDQFVHRDSSGLTPNLQGVFTLNEGVAYGEDFTLQTRSSSWATFWDYVGVYVEPLAIVRTDALIGDTFDVDLHKGYLKAAYANIELEFGRDVLGWGPASQGDLILSPNAPPLEFVKLSTPEPFRLPGVLREVGEWQMTYFIARLEKDRTIARPLLSGLRVTFQPSSYLKFGFSNAFQAFGTNGVELDASTFFQRIFVPEFDLTGRTINSLIAYDVVLTLPFVRDSAFLQSVKFYWQRGNDNVEKVTGFLGGGNILGVALDGGRWDLRFEYAETRDGNAVWYTHPTYQSGFAFEKFYLGHPIGGDAQSFFARATYYLTPTAWVAADGRYDEYGIATQPSSTTQQRIGVEGSYQFAWLKRDLVLWGRLEYATLDEPTMSEQQAIVVQILARWRF